MKKSAENLEITVLVLLGVMIFFGIALKFIFPESSIWFWVTTVVLVAYLLAYGAGVFRQHESADDTAEPPSQ